MNVCIFVENWLNFNTVEMKKCIVHIDIINNQLTFKDFYVKLHNVLKIKCYLLFITSNFFISKLNPQRDYCTGSGNRPFLYKKKQTSLGKADSNIHKKNNNQLQSQTRMMENIGIDARPYTGLKCAK